MVLSLFLVVWWNLSSDVHAAGGSPIVYEGSAVSGASSDGYFLDVTVYSDVNYQYSYYGGGTAPVLTSIPYYNANTLTFNMTSSFPISTSFFNPNSFVVPDGYDHISGYVVMHFSDFSELGGVSGYKINSCWLDVYGSSSSVSYPVSSGDVYFFIDMDVPEGFVFSGNRTNLVCDVSEWVTSPLSVTPVRYNPFFTYSPVRYYFTVTSSDSVTSSDLSDQTDDLTNGFDNSAGSQAADQLGQEVDEYLKQEDALYDQMQYEVPEIDLLSDARGIVLASGFMQSLYVSNEFISKIVTFALSFGLILFIIGWLKKRGS